MLTFSVVPAMFYLGFSKWAGLINNLEGFAQNLSLGITWFLESATEKGELLIIDKGMHGWNFRYQYEINNFAEFKATLAHIHDIGSQGTEVAGEFSTVPRSEWKVDISMRVEAVDSRAH